MPPILVTGGSGFIGCHFILRLLAAGHRVRATVRNLKREAEVRAILKTDPAAPQPHRRPPGAEVLLSESRTQPMFVAWGRGLRTKK